MFESTSPTSSLEVASLCWCLMNGFPYSCSSPPFLIFHKIFNIKLLHSTITAIATCLNVLPFDWLPLCQDSNRAGWLAVWYSLWCCVKRWDTYFIFFFCSLLLSLFAKKMLLGHHATNQRNKATPRLEVLVVYICSVCMLVWLAVAECILSILPSYNPISEHISLPLIRIIRYVSRIS